MTEINKNILRGVTTEYTKSLRAAWKQATPKVPKVGEVTPALGAFDLTTAKARARECVLEQVNAALTLLD